MKIIYIFLVTLLNLYGETKQVLFDIERVRFPYPKIFLVDDFVLYKQQYSISKTSINLPKGPQFEKVSKLLNLLRSDNLPAAKQFFVDPANENVERGLAFIARQELISIVASWREKGHYIVMVTNERGMDKFLLPIVIQETGDLKIETNALFLSSFIGAFGNCISQGMISKLNISAVVVDNSNIGGLFIPQIYLWLSTLVILSAVAFVIWRKRYQSKNQR